MIHPSRGRSKEAQGAYIQNHPGKTFEKAMKCLENGFDEVCVVYGYMHIIKSGCVPLIL